MPIHGTILIKQKTSYATCNALKCLQLLAITLDAVGAVRRTRNKTKQNETARGNTTVWFHTRRPVTTLVHGWRWSPDVAAASLDNAGMSGDQHGHQASLETTLGGGSECAVPFLSVLFLSGFVSCRCLFLAVYRVFLGLPCFVAFVFRFISFCFVCFGLLC